MITFLRSIFNSKLGLAISFIFIALVGIAFAAGDITGSSSFGGGGGLTGGGSTVAKAGGQDIDSVELQQRVDNTISIERRQQPGLDMATFLTGGGFEATLEEMINTAALKAFGKDQGIEVSKRLVDGQIASIPAFFGPTGQFDENVYRQALADRRVNSNQFREDVGNELLARQLLTPAMSGSRLPLVMARPYAEILLESRTGLVGLIPSSAIPTGTPPTDQELATYYKRNVARYTVPERRVIRYAPFGASTLGAKAEPTEAEVSAYYSKNAARYAASETRDLTQVIVQDQKAAQAFEAKVKAGTSFADAAKQARLEPVSLKAQTRAAFGGLSSNTAATAAFALAQNGVSAPQRSGLGWHIVRVDAITSIPAKPLAAVRGEILEALKTEKLTAALADLVAKVQEQVDGGATFDEVVKANGLNPVTTPAITSTGADPENPALQPDPRFARFLAPMFEAQTDDDPGIEQIVPDREFALAKLERIIAAAPRPLAQIKTQVTADFERDRAARQARTIADAVIAKVGKGVAFAQALREAGIALPAAQPVGGRYQDLVQGQRVPPPLALMFSMKEKTAKRLEAPANQGWFVVWLDKITPGDIRTAPNLVAQVQAESSREIGGEYAMQFVNAIKAEVGVKRYPEAEAKLKRQLSGAASQ
ncbi:SurA N-terminal domain-containing protein [Sphingomonas colocasiae]|uniref:Parvulin-like PPIase n=1 Tax=Sphingomonas colocasiae TaxID=1848973 RepID=A0ABS7PP30_9SPHN|nr:SurA N-terminal domain-containing protein [Sphingomonas colocasiae]MBY8822993.1 SurA N-terminal domain-containing protein [Sphingomonas colocasiae]